MPREISNTLRAQAYSTYMDMVAVEGIEVSHSSLSEPIRLVNNNQDISFDGNTYYASSFNFKLPSQEGSAPDTATLSIQNTDRAFMELIRTITDYPIIKYMLFLVDEETTIEAGPYEFEFRGAKYNVETVTGELAYTFYPQRALSTIRQSINNFPSLRDI